MVDSQVRVDVGVKRDIETSNWDKYPLIFDIWFLMTAIDIYSKLSYKKWAMSRIWSQWTWGTGHNQCSISTSKASWPKNSSIKYQVSSNHFSKSSTTHKRIITSSIKPWGCSKKISQSSNTNIKPPIIARPKLQRRHKNYQGHLRLLKLPMSLKRLPIKTCCLRLKSSRNKLSIWTKKWKINFGLLNKRFNLSFKSTILTFNKIRQWTKRPRIQYKICKEF